MGTMFGTRTMADRTANSILEAIGFIWDEEKLESVEVPLIVQMEALTMVTKQIVSQIIGEERSDNEVKLDSSADLDDEAEREWQEWSDHTEGRK